MKREQYILVLSILCFPVAALAINVCTDASGTTIYQQQPCPSLAPHQENAPVATTKITAAVVSETIRRFRTSLSNRDATTASNFLAPTFTASIQTSKGVEQYDRASFADMLARVLNAATSYQSASQCAAPALAGAAATVTCEVRESYILLKRSAESVSTDTHQIALVDGAAKFVSITSVQHEK